MKLNVVPKEIRFRLGQSRRFNLPERIRPKGPGRMGVVNWLSSKARRLEAVSADSVRRDLLWGQAVNRRPLANWRLVSTKGAFGIEP